MKKSLLFLFTMLLGLMSYAQERDIKELELGVEYSGAAFTTGYFKYTATETCTLIALGSTGIDAWTDETFTEQRAITTLDWVAGGKETLISVVADETYYFSTDEMLSAWHFTMNKMSEEIKLESVTPETGTVFPLGDSGQVVMGFSIPVSYTSAILQTGTTAVKVSGNSSGKVWSFEFTEILFGWLKDGIMNAGDTFTLSFEGVHSISDVNNIYGEDGKLVLEWIACDKPAEVVKVTKPEKFLSYWPIDSEDGKLIVEYDRELDPSADTQVRLWFGSAEVEGDYYQESPAAIISGKTVTVDFRGKRRIPAEMVASGTNYGTFYIKINSLKSIDGQGVFSEVQGAQGSFQDSFDYEELSENITTEFLPASGASLEGVSSVELWISNSEAITFSGVNVSYKDAENAYQEVNYTKEECNYVNEGLDGITLTIPITAAMQTGNNVTITLNDVAFIDGLEREIQAIYNIKEELVPVTISPADKEKVDVINEIILTFDSNVSVVEGATAPLYTNNGRTKVCDLTVTAAGKEVTLTAPEAVTEVGYYIVDVPAEIIFNDKGVYNEGFIYHYEIVAAVSQDFVFTPADGSTVESLSTILVHYAPGFSVSWNYSPTLYNEAGEAVAVVSKRNGFEELWPDNWDDPVTDVYMYLQHPRTGENITVDVPGNYTLSIPAGTFNLAPAYEEGNAEMTVNYTIEGAATPSEDFTFDPASGSTIESLSTIKVNYAGAGGFGCNWYDTAYLTNEVGEKVAVVDREEIWPESWTDPISEMILHLMDVTTNEAVTITEAGTYTLTLPARYFALGENGNDSEEIVLTYIISSASGVADILAGENHYEVYNVAGVRILTTDNVADLNTLTGGLYIINGKKVYLRK